MTSLANPEPIPATGAADPEDEAEWDGADVPLLDDGDAVAAARGGGGLTGVVLSVGAGLLVIVLLASILLSGRPGPSVAAPVGGVAATPAYEAPAVGYWAPHFTLDNLQGGQTSLVALRGHPVWINYWATWCPPCRGEMPVMKQLYDRYKAQGLVILGVDDAESADTVKQFINQNGYDWSFVLDHDAAVGRAYNASGIPTHAFVDTTGVVRAYQIGGLTSTAMEADLAQIMSPPK